MTPSEVSDMPAPDYELFARYWAEEPWGPARDNAHVAMALAFIHRLMYPKATPLDPSRFIVGAPRRYAATERRGVGAFLAYLEHKAAANDGSSQAGSAPGGADQ